MAFERGVQVLQCIPDSEGALKVFVERYALATIGWLYRPPYCSEGLLLRQTRRKPPKAEGKDLGETPERLQIKQVPLANKIK